MWENLIGLVDYILTSWVMRILFIIWMAELVIIVCYYVSVLILKIAEELADIWEEEITIIKNFLRYPLMFLRSLGVLVGCQLYGFIKGPRKFFREGPIN
ncbi:MAG: hypothetical protein WC639_02635 [Patescibacteria group bacterium]